MAKKSLAVLDFGTSKVLCIIAEENAYKRISVVGPGMAQYDGYMDGHWNVPEQVDDAIAGAIRVAEEKSETKVREVYVGVPGEFSRVYVMEASVTLQGADPRVRPEDVERLQREATRKLEQPSGVIIHRGPAWFRVDDGSKTIEPVDRKGSSLEGMIGFVIADQFFTNDITKRLNRLGITVKGFFSSSVGQILQCIPYEERDRTCVMVDIGYYSTEITAAEGDTAIWQKILPVGGFNIAADLVYGLKLDLDVCEKIKRSFTLRSMSDTPEIQIPGKDGKMEQLDGELVKEIITSRIDEILENIDDAIDNSGVQLSKWSNVYVTGGGILPIDGAKIYVGSKMRHNMREAPAKLLKMKPSQIFTSGSGLVEMIFNILEQQEQSVSFLDKIKNIFKK